MLRLRQRIDELEELNKTKTMYKGLFEFIPDAIVVVNRDGRIVQVTTLPALIDNKKNEYIVTRCCFG